MPFLTKPQSFGESRTWNGSLKVRCANISRTNTNVGLTWLGRTKGYSFQQNILVRVAKVAVSWKRNLQKTTASASILFGLNLRSC